ncbi:MAG: radical SAM protein [Thermoanaerobaculia bacterium]
MSDSEYPFVPSLSVDTLWFQVAGTLCNLRCTHCFISCSPENHSHGMLSLTEVRERLLEARELGVREYYFTGGEPFLNREILPILEETLRQGPAHVLTNGVSITRDLARRLKALEGGSEYSFDLRVSIDGYDARTNDPVRGEGTFERILQGIRHLSAAGFNPVITVTEVCDDAASAAGRAKFLEFLRSIGLSRPRLKVLSLFRIGAEENRLRAYESWETLRGQSLSGEDAEKLQCSSCRMITSKGVYVCPILIDRPEARMGRTVRETLRPFELKHSACFTCHEYGVTCKTN